MKDKSLIAVTGILLFGLFVWDIWPISKSTIDLEFDNALGNQLPIIVCDEMKDFLERKWQVLYPNSIPKGNSSEVSLYSAYEPQEFLSQNENSMCNFAIEARFEILGKINKPIGSIISPYQVEYPLQFEWEVEMEEDDLYGTIWIYLLPEKSNEEISRFPLFAVPIEIQSTSIIGLPLRSFRIIAAGLIVLGVTFYFIFRQERRMI